MRVLIVEDDPGAREALAEMLQRSGAVVSAAESADHAMEVFEAFRPQALICELALRHDNGFSLLARIRALGPERGGNVPALALTVLASEEDQRRAIAAGFQAYLAKPVGIDRLIDVVATLL